MATPTVYIDNNETVYTQVRTVEGNLAQGSTAEVTFGLSDVGELPGQSNWFVNKLVFMAKGCIDLDGSDVGLSEGQTVAGVVPRDIVASYDWDSLNDFQDFKAWPLKGTIAYTFMQGSQNPARNAFSVTKTYSPRSALVLNREQNIVWSYKNVLGLDVLVQLCIYGQFKRGN
ncbi:MAG TPA: hypothetical protein EYN64_03000 [Flavobacteriales bacterium]|nr:hypothetical protein [Flavobacteriales bacterium]